MSLYMYVPSSTHTDLYISVCLKKIIKMNIYLFNPKKELPRFHTNLYIYFSISRPDRPRHTDTYK